MTIQEKLKTVEERIRKDIPRLMQITTGLLVQEKHTDDEEVCKIIDVQGDRLVIYNSEDYFLTTEIEETLAEEYEIIGHEIMLNDISEWLRIKNTDYYLVGDMIMEYIDSEGDIERYAHIREDYLNVDLSSPYLKNQSEELINFLYELTK